MAIEQTAIIPEPADYPKELVTQEEARDLLLQEINDIPIETQQDYELATTWITKLRDFEKTIATIEAEVSRPLKERLARVKGYFALSMSKIFDTEKSLTEKTREYQRKQLIATREAQIKADAEAKKQFDKQVAKGKTPDVPVPIADIVEGPTKTIKSDSGSYTTMLIWRAKPASNADNVPATTRIARRFTKIDWPEIQSFVKSGKKFTFGKEVAPNEFLVKECPGIIVYQDVLDQARGTKRKEFESHEWGNTQEQKG